MGRVEEDIGDPDRSNLAMTCCRLFLDSMQQCSIPEMKYTIMTVIAGYYEQIGDLSQVLRWTQTAKEVAQDVHDEEVQNQAECALALVLANEAVIVLDDPHGLQQTAWARSQRTDLEMLYSRAQGRGDWSCQFEYAKELLHKELNEELRGGK